MPPAGNNGRGKVILNIASVVFLVTSLMSVVAFTSNPLKTLVFDSYARYSAEAEINKRERAAARGEGPQCKGAGCLAPEIIANRNNKNNQTGVAKTIIDSYDAALKGNTAALNYLKSENAGVADQVSKNLEIQDTVAKYLDISLSNTVRNAAGQQILKWKADGTIPADYYQKVANQEVVNTTIATYQDTSLPNAERNAASLKIQAWEKDGTITPDLYTKITTQDTVNKTVATYLDASLSNTARNTAGQQILKWKADGTIPADYYQKVAQRFATQQELVDLPRASATDRKSKIADLQNAVSQGLLTKAAFDQATKYYDINTGEQKPQIATLKVTVEKQQEGPVLTTYTNVVRDTSGNLIAAPSVTFDKPDAGNLLLTAVNQSTTQNGANALDQLKKYYPDFVSLAQSAIQARATDAINQAVELRNNGNSAPATLKTYSLPDLIGDSYFLKSSNPITAVDLKSTACLMDGQCSSTLYSQQAAKGGPVNQAIVNLTNTLSLGNNQEAWRRSLAYGPGSVEFQGAALKSFTIGGAEAIGGTIGITEYLIPTLTAASLGGTASLATTFSNLSYAAQVVSMNAPAWASTTMNVIGMASLTNQAYDLNKICNQDSGSEACQKAQLGGLISAVILHNAMDAQSWQNMGRSQALEEPINVTSEFEASHLGGGTLADNLFGTRGAIVVPKGQGVETSGIPVNNWPTSPQAYNVTGEFGGLTPEPWPPGPSGSIGPTSPQVPGGSGGGVQVQVQTQTSVNAVSSPSLAKQLFPMAENPTVSLVDGSSVFIPDVGPLEYPLDLPTPDLLTPPTQPLAAPSTVATLAIPTLAPSLLSPSSGLLGITAGLLGSAETGLSTGNLAVPNIQSFNLTPQGYTQIAIEVTGLTSTQPLTDAYRTLKPGGILLLQGATSGLLAAAQRAGFGLTNTSNTGAGLVNATLQKPDSNPTLTALNDFANEFAQTPSTVVPAPAPEIATNVPSVTEPLPMVVAGNLANNITHALSTVIPAINIPEINLPGVQTYPKTQTKPVTQPVGIPQTIGNIPATKPAAVPNGEPEKYWPCYVPSGPMSFLGTGEDWINGCKGRVDAQINQVQRNIEIEQAIDAKIHELVRQANPNWSDEQIAEYISSNLEQLRNFVLNNFTVLETPLGIILIYTPNGELIQYSYRPPVDTTIAQSLVDRIAGIKAEINSIQKSQLTGPQSWLLNQLIASLNGLQTQIELNWNKYFVQDAAPAVNRSLDIVDGITGTMKQSLNALDVLVKLTRNPVLIAIQSLSKTTPVVSLPSANIELLAAQGAALRTQITPSMSQADAQPLETQITQISAAIDKLIMAANPSFTDADLLRYKIDQNIQQRLMGPASGQTIKTQPPAAPATSIIPDLPADNLEALQPNTQIDSATQADLNNPNLPQNRIAKQITGFEPKDEGLTAKLIGDHYALKTKYGLPPRELRFSDPEKYNQLLNDIAAQQNIKVEFVDPATDPMALKLHAPVSYYNPYTNIIWLRNNTDAYYLGDLEHELVHGLQHGLDPKMPVEQMEYESYLVANTPIGSNTLDNPANRLKLFDQISVSVNSYYVNELGKTNPWLTPPQPLAAPAAPAVQPSTNPSPLQQIGNAISNVVNPPMGIIDPNIANLLNLQPRIGIRPWINPDTGGLQFPIGRVTSSPDLPDVTLEVSEPTPDYMANLAQARVTGDPITLYKGIQKFDPTIGAILPGGLSTTPNTTKFGSYPVGKGKTFSDILEAYRHALTGDTSTSGFSSWSPNIKTAIGYAKGGTVVSTTISLRDPRVIDISPLFTEQGVITIGDFRTIWVNAIKSRTLSIAHDGTPIKQAKVEATKQMFKNGENTKKSNEILIQGSVTDYHVLSPEEINQVRNRQSVLVTTPPTDITSAVIDNRATRSALSEELNPANYSSKDLIQYLAEDLGALYSESIGVWEGYTLGQHNQMVLNQFDRYFSRSPLPGGVTNDFMRTFLALHDMGKPTAVLAGNKSLQYKFTIPDMIKELNKFGFSQPQINLAVALVNGDPIGDTLKGGNIQANAAKIVNDALNSGLSSEDYFKLLTIYYQVDAGSYTADAGGLESLDSLFIFDHAKGTITFAPGQQALIDKLHAAVLSIHPPAPIFNISEQGGINLNLIAEEIAAIGVANLPGRILSIPLNIPIVRLALVGTMGLPPFMESSISPAALKYAAAVMLPKLNLSGLTKWVNGILHPPLGILDKNFQNVFNIKPETPPQPPAVPATVTPATTEVVPTTEQTNILFSRLNDFLSSNLTIEQGLANHGSLTMTTLFYADRVNGAIDAINTIRGPNDIVFNQSTPIVAIANSSDLILEGTFKKGIVYSATEPQIPQAKDSQDAINNLFTTEKIVFDSMGNRVSIEKYLQDRYKNLIAQGLKISVGRVSVQTALDYLQAGTRWTNPDQRRADPNGYAKFLESVGLPQAKINTLAENNTPITIISITSPQGKNFYIPVVDNSLLLEKESAYGAFAHVDYAGTLALGELFLNSNAIENPNGTNLLEAFSTIFHELDHSIYSAWRGKQAVEDNFYSNLLYEGLARKSQYAYLEAQKNGLAAVNAGSSKQISALFDFLILHTLYIRDNDIGSIYSPWYGIGYDLMQAAMTGKFDVSPGAYNTNGIIQYLKDHPTFYRGLVQHYIDTLLEVNLVIHPELSYSVDAPSVIKELFKNRSAVGFLSTVFQDDMTTFVNLSTKYDNASQEEKQILLQSLEQDLRQEMGGDSVDKIIASKTDSNINPYDWLLSQKYFVMPSNKLIGEFAADTYQNDFNDGMADFNNYVKQQSQPPAAAAKPLISEQGGINLNLIAEEISLLRFQSPFGPNGLRWPIYQVSPPVTPTPQPPAETQLLSNNLITNYSERLNVSPDTQLPTLPASDITSLYPAQQDFLNALQNEKSANLIATISKVKETITFFRIRLVETSTIENGETVSYYTTQGFHIPETIRIPSIQAFQAAGYSKGMATVLYGEALLHEWGHVLDGLAKPSLVPADRFGVLTEARQYYFVQRVLALGGANVKNDAEFAEINQFLEWLGVPQQVLSSMPGPETLQVNQQNQVTIPTEIPASLLFTSPSQPPAAAPVDLSTTTTDANGDPFTSLGSVYKSESPAIARRVADIENQVATLTREEVSTIIFNAKNFDAPTGLYNQTAFAEGLQLEAKYAEKTSSDLTVVAFKLTNFKKVNDILGHLAGDNLLKAVSNVLRGTARSTDLAARIGGNEFALILPNTTDQEAQVVVEKVLTGLQNLKNSAPENAALKLAYLDFAVSQMSPNVDIPAFLVNLDNLVYSGQRGTTIPSDLTQATVAPDGDQFISLAEPYATDAQAIARRSSDIEKAVPALTPEEIKNAIVQAKYIDPLTGIFNKSLINDVIQVEMDGANKNQTDLSAAILDLKKFGDLNANFGRPEGDRALKEVADLLLKNVRPTDIPARFGGDEFVVLFPGTNAEQAKVALQRYDAGLTALKAANPGDPVIQSINVNYGVVQMQPGDTVETFLQKADQEMYAMKGASTIQPVPQPPAGTSANASSFIVTQAKATGVTDQTKIQQLQTLVAAIVPEIVNGSLTYNDVVEYINGTDVGDVQKTRLLQKLFETGPPNTFTTPEITLLRNTLEYLQTQVPKTAQPTAQIPSLSREQTQVEELISRAEAYSGLSVDTQQRISDLILNIRQAQDKNDNSAVTTASDALAEELDAIDSELSSDLNFPSPPPSAPSQLSAYTKFSNNFLDRLAIALDLLQNFIEEKLHPGTLTIHDSDVQKENVNNGGLLSTENIYPLPSLKSSSLLTDIQKRNLELAIREAIAKQINDQILKDGPEMSRSRISNDIKYASWIGPQIRAIGLLIQSSPSLEINTGVWDKLLNSGLDSDMQRAFSRAGEYVEIVDSIQSHLEDEQNSDRFLSSSHPLTAGLQMILDSMANPNLPKARLLIGVDGVEPNAYSYGYDIFINLALIKRLGSIDEIAAFLAHEQTHFEFNIENKGLKSPPLFLGDLPKLIASDRAQEYNADAIQKKLIELQNLTLPDGTVIDGFNTLAIYPGLRRLVGPRSVQDMVHGNITTRGEGVLLESRLIDAEAGISPIETTGTPIPSGWKAPAIKASLRETLLANSIGRDFYLAVQKANPGIRKELGNNLLEILTRHDYLDSGTGDKLIAAQKLNYLLTYEISLTRQGLTQYHLSQDNRRILIYNNLPLLGNILNADPNDPVFTLFTLEPTLSSMQKGILNYVMPIYRNPKIISQLHDNGLPETPFDAKTFSDLPRKAIDAWKFSDAVHSLYPDPLVSRIIWALTLLLNQTYHGQYSRYSGFLGQPENLQNLPLKLITSVFPSLNTGGYLPNQTRMLITLKGIENPGQPKSLDDYYNKQEVLSLISLYSKEFFQTHFKSQGNVTFLANKINEALAILEENKVITINKDFIRNVIDTIRAENSNIDQDLLQSLLWKHEDTVQTLLIKAIAGRNEEEFLRLLNGDGKYTFSKASSWHLEKAFVQFFIKDKSAGAWVTNVIRRGWFTNSFTSRLYIETNRRGSFSPNDDEFDKEKRLLTGLEMVMYIPVASTSQRLDYIKSYLESEEIKQYLQGKDLTYLLTITNELGSAASYPYNNSEDQNPVNPDSVLQLFPYSLIKEAEISRIRNTSSLNDAKDAYLEIVNLSSEIYEPIYGTKNQKFLGNTTFQAQWLRQIHEVFYARLTEEISKIDIKTADAIPLYSLFEDVLPESSEKNALLVNLTRKFIDVLPNDKLGELLTDLIKRGMFDKDTYDYFVNQRLHTEADFNAFATYRESYLKGLIAKGDTKAGGLVVADTALDIIVDDKLSLDLFEAMLKTSESDARLKELLYWPWFVGTQVYGAANGYELTLENGEIVVTGEGKQNYISFDDFYKALFDSSTEQRAYVLNKLLTGPNGVLTTRSGRLAFAQLVSDKLPKNDPLSNTLIKVLNSATRVLDEARLFLGFVQPLSGMILQNPPQKSPNTDAGKIIYQNLKNLHGTVFNIFWKAKFKLSDKNVDASSLSRFVAKSEQLSPTTSSVETFNIINGFIDTTEKHFELPTISSNQNITPSTLQKSPDALDIVVGVAENLGAVGVRFLQVMVQYMDIPPEYQVRFRKVFDAVAGQDMFGAWDTITKVKQYEASNLNPENRDVTQFVDHDLVRIVKRLSGGSIVSVFLAEVHDKSPQTNAILPTTHLEVIKIRNPNAETNLFDTANELLRIVDNLATTDRGNASTYRISTRMINDIKEWVKSDIRDETFLTLDPIYAQNHVNFTATNGVKIRVVPALRPNSKDIKRELFIPGPTLNALMQIQADMVTNGKALSDEIQAAQSSQDTELVRVLTNIQAKKITIEDFIKQINIAIAEDTARHLIDPTYKESDNTLVHLIHSDIHPGNVIVGFDNNGNTIVYPIDRNLYLRLSSQDVEFFQQFLTDTNAADYQKLLRTVEYFSSFASDETKKNLDTHLLALAVGAKIKLLKENSQLGMLTIIMQEIEKQGIPIPLRVRIMFKNILSLEGMLRGSNLPTFSSFVQARMSKPAETAEPLPVVDISWKDAQDNDSTNQSVQPRVSFWINTYVRIKTAFRNTLINIWPPPESETPTKPNGLIGMNFAPVLDNWSRTYIPNYNSTLESGGGVSALQFAGGIINWAGVYINRSAIRTAALATIGFPPFVVSSLSPASVKYLAEVIFPNLKVASPTMSFIMNIIGWFLK